MKFENVQLLILKVVLQSRLLCCRFEAKKKSERQIFEYMFLFLKGVK